MLELTPDNQYFTEKYPLAENNNSENRKDKIGRLFGVVFLCMLICFVLYYRSRQKGWLRSGIVLSLVWFGMLISDPIIVLYMFNAFLNLFTRTPAFFSEQDKRKQFPGGALLEKPDNFQRIKKEVETLLEHQDKISPVNQVYGSQNNNIKADSDGWRVLVLKTGKTIVNEQYCPFLVSLVKDNPDVISCLVSILQPQKQIPIHVGYSKSILRYQLAVVVPKDRKNCFIWVNGNKYSWTEGKSVMFDDCFPHLVKNQTDDVRVIIYMDVLRKYENSFLNWLNKSFISLFVNSSFIAEETKKTEVQLPI
jgi:aspartyl/asparaginyl beta-hydroxylase (cupin superfamily)